MKLLTDAQATELLLEFDNTHVEKSFRRGGTFYAAASLVVDQEVIDYVKEQFDVDLSERTGWAVCGDGYWADDDGLDLYSFNWSKPSLVHVPESVVVTPAHTVTEWEVVND